MKKTLFMTLCALSFGTFAGCKPSKPIEAAFSPSKQSEALIVRVLDCSQKSVRLAAYSFTSPNIVKALIDAKKRGVDVQIVADTDGNQSKASKAALNVIATSGIPARLNDKYAIHHDKYIVADGVTVQTGSFNYSQAAAKSNSENVIVVWSNKDIASAYLKHWQSRFDEGIEFKSSY